jgi:hypothetical protein
VALAALDETAAAHEIATAIVNALGIPGEGKPKDVAARAAAHLGEPCPPGRPQEQLLALARIAAARPAAPAGDEYLIPSPPITAPVDLLAGFGAPAPAEVFDTVFSAPAPASAGGMDLLAGFGAAPVAGGGGGAGGGGFVEDEVDDVGDDFDSVGAPSVGMARRDDFMASAPVGFDPSGGGGGGGDDGFDPSSGGGAGFGFVEDDDDDEGFEVEAGGLYRTQKGGVVAAPAPAPAPAKLDFMAQMQLHAARWAPPTRAEPCRGPTHPLCSRARGAAPAGPRCAPSVARRGHSAGRPRRCRGAWARVTVARLLTLVTSGCAASPRRASRPAARGTTSWRRPWPKRPAASRYRPPRRPQRSRRRRRRRLMGR